MKKHIHHIEISHTSPNLSGGEKALIEILRYLSNNEAFLQTVYTSESGVEVYRKLLKDSASKINFVIIGKKRIEKIHDYIAYFSRIPLALFFLRKFDKQAEHIIFSHEEFLPTSIFSYFLKKINKSAKWIVFFHMKSPSVMRGFEGEYTNKWKFPSIRIIRYKIEQWVFFLLTKNNVDRVLTVNECYDEFLKTKYNNLYTLKIFGGEPVHVIKRYSGVEIGEHGNTEKKYDLSFMARFHEQKGVFEVVDIISRLKKVKSDITIVMLGGGVKRIEDKFFQMVKDNNLENNIIYKGYITGDEKYNILAQSKIFLFPSYYESFGQVALEAMKCGLPVVAYDLPPFAVFKSGMVKVPTLDNTAMTEEILRLLDDKVYYDKMIHEAEDFAKDFSWEKTGKEVEDVLTNLN